MKKIKIIALIGKAGSGKDFWLRKICDNDESLHEIVSCTTRPARWNERPDINYHFLSDSQFLSNHFIEQCVFRGWRYGTRYSDLDPEKVNVGVFNLRGIEQLIKNKQLDLTIIYLKTDDALRLIRQLERDASDIEEIFRRYKTDEKDFNEDRIEKISEQVSFYHVINNSTDSYDDDEFIYEDLAKIIEEAKSK